MYEGEFMSFDDYKLKESAEEITCDDCGEKLRRSYSSVGIHIPDHFKAVEVSGGTYDYAKNLMTHAKRPSGKREKIFY